MAEERGKVAEEGETSAVEMATTLYDSVAMEKMLPTTCCYCYARHLLPTILRQLAGGRASAKARP